MIVVVPQSVVLDDLFDLVIGVDLLWLELCRWLGGMPLGSVSTSLRQQSLMLVNDFNLVVRFHASNLIILFLLDVAVGFHHLGWWLHFLV